MAEVPAPPLPDEDREERQRLYAGRYPDAWKMGREVREAREERLAWLRREVRVFLDNEL